MILFWHRRDLRIADNAGLYKALKTGVDVQPIFIFDLTILEELPKNDQRVLFIYQEIERLKREYRNLGSDLNVFYGNPLDVFEELIQKQSISHVVSNRDYEPYALERDKAVFEFLKQHNIAFLGAKDHVIFEKNEVLKEDGLPYKVFTPYANKWKSLMQPEYLQPYFVEQYFDNLHKADKISPLITLSEMGF